MDLLLKYSKMVNGGVQIFYEYVLIILYFVYHATAIDVPGDRVKYWHLFLLHPSNIQLEK